MSNPIHPTSELQDQSPDKLEVAYAMQRRGTPFVKALANAIILAEGDDLEKIRTTWPHLWARYAEHAIEIFKKD